MIRHFLDLSDAGGDAIAMMIADAIDRKEARVSWPKGKVDADAPLAGHVLAMIFEKSSTRTRVSFDVAIRQLGGTSIVMDSGSMQLGRGETVADTAKVLSRMCDAIMIRTDDHAKIEELAANATVPVINGLTDLSHPCQIVADLLTLVERGKALPGLEVCWLGDGNNVLNSIVEAAGLMKFNVRIGCPQGYDPDQAFIETAQSAGVKISVHRDEMEAVSGADVVITDTWVSMGQEHVHNKMAAMMPYQVNDVMMEQAKSDALFMHCLPAHRGEEVMPSVIDGPQSVVWDEAENRIHAQKSVLRWVFNQI
ncbi:ornithine carbamoyltransferase [Parasphingorhabdus halotolerans]|uniref:Ornithine carbamoyltransferase n=1 Tax=Parasphingorhabdus halotolerans TaxID=2725558 RepID=A0A6H2DLE3_9SPHN|nr:ornithine carbamoyltransferase [Parasphingorhabdus halotolerans]QJB68476.1 ornithine carbamoyltransferase [Parasphingorhabdus halotolerans]